MFNTLPTPRRLLWSSHVVRDLGLPSVGCVPGVLSPAGARKSDGDPGPSHYLDSRFSSRVDHSDPQVVGATESRSNTVVAYLIGCRVDRRKLGRVHPGGEFRARE